MANDTRKPPHAAVESVRIARVGDAKAISEIYAPYVCDTVISFETVPPDEEEMARRIARVLPNFPWLVYEDDGLPVGYAYGSQHRERAAYRWSVDVGIYIAPQAHRRGVGGLLYAVLLAALRLQDYHRAYGGITLPNAASVGLHEASGFSAIGVYREVGFKFGAWRDVGWWGLALNPTSHEPSEPLPFTQDIFEAARRAVAGSR
ncbi:MAG: GNAT family N-acetyltransferase [Parvibaculum sp.]|uniref:arsinothricin resistance N-acetyltransferase ArsN1 family B n=1 Tax=Parvibaculum sp. TaxID=2024848 RepID=UPI0025CFD1E4|nr:arsinothricin resistance N-acetyltransferase ArsN1 family B [Parvibaculum sp.]MCE9648066.1 GNAT family N-acetyltransferase [Parvibaculum sp.]